MASFTSVSIPIPKDWQDFERGICILFRDILKDPNTQQNGRAGQEQHGVDVFGKRGGGNGPQVGVQCKGKDGNFGEPVTAKELEAEVRKSAAFTPSLKEFILVTTAQTDAKIQAAARDLEAKIRQDGRDLSISVMGWQDLETVIGQSADALRFFHPDSSPFTDEILNSINELRKELNRDAAAGNTNTQSAIQPSSRPEVTADAFVVTDSLDKHLHEQINTYRDLLRDNRPKTALALLEKLRETSFSGASNKIKFRIVANIGACQLNLGNYEVAAEQFLAAYDYAPEEIPAIANKIAALLIKGRSKEAHALAVTAIATHPHSSDIALQRLQARADGETLEQAWNTLGAKVQNDPGVLWFRIFATREQGDAAWKKLAVEGAAAHPKDDRLSILKADEVLERVLEADRSMLGVAFGDAPTQAELLQAAEVMEGQWTKSRSGEGPPEFALAHNGALLWKLLRNNEKARQMLDAGMERGLSANEPIKLRLSLYKRPEQSQDAVRMSDKLSDTPQHRIIRAEILADVNAAKALELLDGRDAYQSREAIAAAQTVVEILLKENRFDEALAEAGRIKDAIPDDPNTSLIVYRAKLARSDQDAESELDEAVAKVKDDTDFPTRFLVCEALQQAHRNEEIVQLLDGVVAIGFDSMALRVLIAAASNSDMRSKLRDLLAKIPKEVRDVPFYRNARVALAVQTGDIDAALREIRGYLGVRPRSLEMHLQLMHALFRKGRAEELKVEAAKPAKDFDGLPEDFMKLAQFKETYASWREAYALAYSTLLKNPHEPAVALGYVGVFLRPGHTRELDIQPKQVAENAAIALQTDDEKTSSYIIEPDADLRPSAQYLAPSHRLATALLGMEVGGAVELPDGTSAKIVAIKPKELHALHELLENFQNFFPEAEGLERVRFDPASEGGMKEVAERLREQHDAIKNIQELYESGRLPLALAARAVGADVIEFMLGLSASGKRVRVCQGTHFEREQAFAAIKRNERKGCALDLPTFHTARRLGVLDAIAAVCGPIGVVDRTQRRYQRKLQGLSERIDEPGISLSWEQGKIIRIETTVEQKKAAMDALKADAAWITDHAKIVPANGSRDPSADLRELMRRFGNGFVDELRAAEGNNLLLVSDDFMLRGLAGLEFDIPSTWLQPVLMQAKEIGALTEEAYRKAIAAMIEAHFYFISVDAKLLTGSVEGCNDVSLPRNYQALASALGGKDADLQSHVNVAGNAIARTWNDQALPWLLRQAMVGELLRNLMRGRTAGDQRNIIRYFAEFGRNTLKDPSFEQYLIGWLRGHFVTF